MTMKMILIYVTFGSQENAHEVANNLVEQRLVSCANIFPTIESIYHWEGKVEQGEEVVVIFKTRAELFDQVEAAIKALHSFDCPCIVALPIESGHQPFLDWIESETSS